MTGLPRTDSPTVVRPRLENPKGSLPCLSGDGIGGGAVTDIAVEDTDRVPVLGAGIEGPAAAWLMMEPTDF